MKKVILISLFLFSAYLVNAQRAVFRYEYAGSAGKSGTFSFYDAADNQLFSVEASAGYNNDAQNPYSQGLKNKGPIPNGKWYIYQIKNHNSAILRLEPGDDVFTNGRDGFLIHGFASGSTPEESSRGCIILGPNERKILRDAFINGGYQKIPVAVLAVDSSGNSVSVH